jgi:hypothetical protein
LYPQDSDSLFLEKIKNIDFSLTSLDENTIENLFSTDVSFSEFYDALFPVGEWIQITKEEIDEEMNDGSGESYSSMQDPENEFLFIWRPKNTDEDWKPYINGQWVYTDHGWLWASDEKWGWAVFHYGRWWKSSKYGWVWLPGKVWSPAWVQWLISENHIGWCALSPKAKWKVEDGINEAVYKFKNKDEDWVFVEKSKFQNPINSSEIVLATKNSSLIPKSQRVLDIRFENNKMINNGPDVKDIEIRTGKILKQRELKYLEEKRKTVVGENDVKLYKPKFKKLEIDKNTGKVKIKEKPKKFKRSPRVKRLIKKYKILIRHRK